MVELRSPEFRDGCVDCAFDAALLDDPNVPKHGDRDDQGDASSLASEWVARRMRGRRFAREGLRDTI